MSLPRSIASALAGLALVLGTFTITPQTLAETKITLTDGTELVGDIVREGDQFVIIATKVGEITEEKFLVRRDIASISRDIPEEEVAEAMGVKDTGPVMRGEKETADIPAGATRIAFITLKEEVGSFFNTDALERSVNILKEMPDETRPEILVIQIDSGGGALNEMQKIVRYIQDEVETEFRTVAWIEYAISAACMTSWVIDEVYIMRKAPIGGCTAFFTTPQGTVAVSGVELEQLLVQMEEVSRLGKKDPLVMRAMEIRTTLSADIEDDGTIIWYPNAAGEYLVSPSNEVLTLNSYEAVKFGICRAIADTKDQLAKELGCVEWVEVGQEADELMVEFRESVKSAQTDLMITYQEMQISLNAMNATPELRNKKRHFGRARQKYQKIRSTVHNRAPSLLTYGQFSTRFFEYWDEQMELYAEQLGNA